MTEQRLTMDQLSAMRGRDVFTNDGEKLGEVDQMFFDEATNAPKWIEVSNGLFNTHHVLVPVEGASVRDVELHLPLTRDQIEQAPEAEEMTALSLNSEQALSRHYGVSTTTGGDASQERGSDDGSVRIVRMWVWPADDLVTGETR